MIRTLLTMLFVAATVQAGEIRPRIVAPPDAPLFEIDFGSCARQDQPQPIWDAVLADAPDLFVFLGDNVYADSERPAVIEASYRRWESDHPGFRTLRSTVPILATWDDHDYGANDAGAEFPAGEASERIFLDFWGEPADGPLRDRAGIHDARVFGPPGKRVQVILLDTRSFRSPLAVGKIDDYRPMGRVGGYDPRDSDTSTVLGEAQWAWLGRQLEQPAEIRIIASSIQVLSEDHRFENWGNFPRERARLFDLIACKQADGVLFLSGDRHHAEISRLPTAGRDDDLTGERTENPVGYPLMDVTASSLNAPRPWQNEINRHRVGALYFEANHGRLSVTWDDPVPALRIQIRDVQGEPVLEHRVALSELRASHRSCSDRTVPDPSDGT